MLGFSAGPRFLYPWGNSAVERGAEGENCCGVQHPDVINDRPRLISDSVVVPDEAMDLVPGHRAIPLAFNQDFSIPEEIVR
jgi:hypothetical protein